MQKGRENFILKARQSVVHITITENLKLIRVILERKDLNCSWLKDFWINLYLFCVLKTLSYSIPVKFSLYSSACGGGGHFRSFEKNLSNHGYLARSKKKPGCRQWPYGYHGLLLPNWKSSKISFKKMWLWRFITVDETFSQLKLS